MAAVVMPDPIPEQVVEWVKASTAAQGIPDRVTDAGIVEAVTTLLREGREPVPSESPNGDEAGGVEGVAAPHSGVDYDVVEDGADDGVLAGEGEIGPGVA